MSIDIKSETLLTLSQAARILPSSRLGRPVTLSCVLRWVLRGLKVPGGNVVRLEAIRLGGKWITSQEALQRFADRQTPCLDAAGEVSQVRSAGQRSRANARAAAELAKIGI